MTKTLNDLELAALATAAVPGLNIVGVKKAQYGDEDVSITGVVDSSGGHWTVVAPHDDGGGAGIESQLRVLSFLGRAHDKRAIPFDVPRPAGIVRPDQGGRAMVHPALRGRQLSWDDLSDEGLLPTSLARSLAAFHELPVRPFGDTGIPAYTAAESRDRHRAMVSQAAASGFLSPVLQTRWERALDEDALWRFDPTPVHGDLGPSSVLAKDGAVTAIVGFSSAQVGDPAQDISWILAQASDGFLDQFRSAYSLARSEDDLHIWTRAQLLSELAVVRWLVHGLNQDDEAIVVDGREMLADLAESLGGAQLVESGHTGVEVEWSETMVDDTFPAAEGDAPAEPEDAGHGEPTEAPDDLPGDDIDPEDVPTEAVAMPFDGTDPGDAPPPTEDLSSVMDSVLEEIQRRDD